SGYVAKLVIIGNNRVDGEVRNLDRIPDDLRAPLKGNSKFTARIAEEKNKLVQELDAYNNEKGERDGRIEYSSEEERNWFGPLMVTLLPVFLLLGIFFLFILPRFRDPLAGGGFLSNYIKSPARRYERNKLRVTFEDVADMENAKGELQEIVDFLRSPQQFHPFAAQLP